MAYVHVSTSPGGTMKEYRTIAARLSPSEATDGLLARMVGADAAGLHIIDVWESQAHAKRFEAEQLFPAFHAASITPDQNATFTVFDADQVYVRP
jgi:hypothetical protein